MATMKNLLRRILLDTLGKRRENGMWRISVNRVASEELRHLVLLALDGKLGDAILQSSVVRAIKNAYSECRITIVTATNLQGYWRECPGVSDVFTVSSRSDASTFRRLLKLRRLRNIAALNPIDILISFDPIPMIDYFAFIRWVRPRTAIGLSAIQYSIFQISISDPILEVPKDHVGIRFVRTLAALGIDAQIGDLRSFVPQSVSLRSRSAAADTNLEITNFFINGYGASPTRTFSISQLTDIVRMLIARIASITITINVNDSQSCSPEVRNVYEEFPGKLILSQPTSDISELFNKIARADAVLTPDTAVAHIAAATRTPLAIVYDDRDFNPICWRPLSEDVVTLIPTTPGPISRFSAAELVNALARSHALQRDV